MKNIKKVAYCKICNLKLVGEKLREYGGDYYCMAHYTEQLEKPIDKYKEARRKETKRIIYGG